MFWVTKIMLKSDSTFKVAFFDTHKFEIPFYKEKAADLIFSFFEVKLSQSTVHLCQGFDAVCVFVNDQVDAVVIQNLKQYGVKIIALRCAGFNNVDIKAAHENSISVVRVEDYSPYAVAEYAVSLIQCLNRKIHKAYNRVREGNFLLDGLVGFDLHGKTIGVIGTGKIGTVFCRIMVGFGCHVLAYDKIKNDELVQLGVKYVDLNQVLTSSDILTLHVPLNENTYHMLNTHRFSLMKNGVMIINTGRGALIDTKALIQNLKNGKIGFAGLDVYEEESQYFFENHEQEVLSDDLLARLITFPNVILTSHQAFLTEQALSNIAWTTIQSLKQFKSGQSLTHQVL